MTYIFQPHGDCDVWLQDGVVFARLQGTWNQQAAEDFEATFKHVAASLVGSQWAHLVYLEDWELCTPDMFPVIERLVSWCLDNGLKRAAQVYSDSAIKQQFIDQMVVEESGDFRRAHFDSAEKAMEWLNSEMAFLG